jgi:hypothetical protein
MVQSGVWDCKMLGKRGLGLRIPPRGPSRVWLVVRQVLEVQLTSVGPEGCLWAHSGHCHWWPLPSLSVTSQQHHTLSRGLILPSTLHSQSGSTASRLPTLFGAMQPLSPPCSMHKASGKGGCSQSAFNLRTSCAYLGLAHHHTPPQRPSCSNTINFYLGITETVAPTFYPHSPFPGNCPQPLFNLSIPFPIQHNSISSPLLTPL